jgi:hypothetical protein
MRTVACPQRRRRLRERHSRAIPGARRQALVRSLRAVRRLGAATTHGQHAGRQDRRHHTEPGRARLTHTSSSIRGRPRPERVETDAQIGAAASADRVLHPGRREQPDTPCSALSASPAQERPTTASRPCRGTAGSQPTESSAISPRQNGLGRLPDALRHGRTGLAGCQTPCATAEPAWQFARRLPPRQNARRRWPDAFYPLRLGSGSLAPASPVAQPSRRLGPACRGCEGSLSRAPAPRPPLVSSARSMSEPLGRRRSRARRPRCGCRGHQRTSQARRGAGRRPHGR